jgi:hypothetical protein
MKRSVSFVLCGSVALSGASAFAQRASAPRPSCGVVSESTIAVAEGPLFDARLAVNERGGAVSLMWDSVDDVEGHDRWGGYASWNGPIPATPVSFESNGIVGGACAPNVELRTTVFDGLPCTTTFAVHDPTTSADPMIRYGVAYDRPTIARSIGQRLELERLAEAHTASAVYVATWGARARSYGGTCDLDDRWQGVSVAPDAPRELRLLTFVPGRAPVAQLLYSETMAMQRAAAATSAAPEPESSPMALAVGAEGGLALWPSRGRMFALSFSVAGVADAAPRELDRGRLGAPTVVARGRAFDAAWSRFNDSTGRYELIGATLSDRRATVAPAVLVAPPRANAFAPALSAQGARVVLAWTEGDLRASALVKVGSSTQTLALAASTAAVIGSARGNRRDPELSSTAAATWMLVQQFDRRTRNGVARIATLRCDGP